MLELLPFLYAKLTIKKWKKQMRNVTDLILDLKTLTLLLLSLSIILAGKEFQSLTALMKKNYKKN